MSDPSLALLSICHEFEIEVDSIEGLFTQEECCSACMRQNLVTFGIQDGDIVRLDVSDPDGDY